MRGPLSWKLAGDADALADADGDALDDGAGLAVAPGDGADDPPLVPAGAATQGAFADGVADD
jgi:hypothetical protein